MNELVKYIVYLGPSKNYACVAEHIGGGVYLHVASVANENLAQEIAGSMNDRIELREEEK